ncbi:MAG: FAD:protein transferase [Actinomycetota bacterium]|nr:FAD:protein transferase [Actinomycetota bacterium]
MPMPHPPRTVDRAGPERASGTDLAEDPLPYGTATWRALGTYVQLVVHPAATLREALPLANTVLEAVDASCSRFRADSDLSRVNRRPGTWVGVDPLLVGVLRTALAAAEDSRGLVCPTLGVHLRTLGYDRDLAEVRAGGGSPDHGPAAVPPPVLPEAWRSIEIRDRSAIRIPVGVELDLGAVGKAHAADLIAARLPGRLGCDVLVSLGGDVAVGTLDTNLTHPWQVEVSEVPVTGSATADGFLRQAGTGTPVDVVPLPAGGIATSTILRRRWSHGGRQAHHLLDPRTGLPVRPRWRTASVLADRCSTANAASTAAVVMGDPAVPWLEARGLAARLVDMHGRVTTVGRWPTGE